MTYLGMCDSPSGHIVVLSNDEATAQRMLYREWTRHIYRGFADQNKIRNFSDLSGFNGASVRAIEKFDKPVIWEML